MIARDIIIPRRSDFVFEAHFKTGSAPLNVGGWKFWFTAKRSLDDLDEAAIFQKVAAPSMGTSVSFHINENDTAEAGEFFYDFKALSPAGYGAPLQGGALSIPPVVTLAAS
jgi:hypothetical protein